METAESMTVRSGEGILYRKKTVFSQSPSGSKQMWSLVTRAVTGKEKHRDDMSKEPTVNRLNQHFCDINRP